MLTGHPDCLLLVGCSDRECSPNTLVPIPDEAANNLIVSYLSSPHETQFRLEICSSESLDTEDSTRPGCFEGKHPLKVVPGEVFRNMDQGALSLRSLAYHADFLRMLTKLPAGLSRFIAGLLRRKPR